jgi:hypothetical protein
MGVTHREFERMVGEKVGAKVVMYALPGEMWHRMEDGSWERYPDYTRTPIPKNG